MHTASHQTMANASLISQLQDCLTQLDQIGAHIAAAQLSACIDSLTKYSNMDDDISILGHSLSSPLPFAD